MQLQEVVSLTHPPGQSPNAGQRTAIESIDGPVLVVAGPGSGKTKTLITRTLNLILNHEVLPEKILLCTFTEKAARQLRDRLNIGLSQCGASGADIHEMTIGTIHSVCQGIIDEYPNEAGVGVWSKTKGLGRGYMVLDELQRMFFMMDHFDEIFGAPDANDKYLGQWKGFWTAIDKAQAFFDKITEENIELAKLRNSGDAEVAAIGTAMTAYRTLLVQNARVDFAHLQWFALVLLERHEPARREFGSKFEHVMVDEYQDTNYIQEQLIFQLASKNKNICVVGDVDQSIYRFRGASTQNLMQFGDRVDQPDLEPVHLATNYRSSQQVIDLYSDFLRETTWGKARYPLDVTADKVMEGKRPEYRANVAIDAPDAKTEGEKVGKLLKALKDAGTISDYNQAAILLHSVRDTHSHQYIDGIRAMRDAGEPIDVYAPRARLYFERPEVMCAFAALHSINRQMLSDRASGFPGQEGESLKDYMQRCVRCFRGLKDHPDRAAFIKTANAIRDELKQLKDSDGRPNKRFIDYFYAIINTPFFGQWLNDELPARHLAQLSKLIVTFSEYYGYDWIGGKSADKVWDKFFNSFIRVLFDGGLNEYEDEEEAFPSGAVQVMTFHQSKGLEFPVIICGSLHAQISAQKKIDSMLQAYYQRPLFDPPSRITEYDKRRLYYVAFSRAKDFLVLTGHNDLTDKVANRKSYFDGAIAKCQASEVFLGQKKYGNVKCKPLESDLVKPVLGFTSHISAYERCPKQFQYQKQYGFESMRGEQYWMGNVVHNTLQDIHDHVLKNKDGELDETLVKQLFEQAVYNLQRQGIEAPKLSPARKAKGEKDLETVALESVQRYVKENGDRLKFTRWAEKEILVDEEGYTLTGVIDLLIHDDTGHVELVDFKAGRKINNEKYREGYANQIRLYCKQAEPKIGKVPDEGYIYWVTEPKGVDPKDPVDIDPALLNSTKKAVDQVAQGIIKKKFPKLQTKDDNVCGICEFEGSCWD